MARKSFVSAREDASRVGGFKLTPQRLAIISYLKANEKHPSADEVYRAVARRFPTMSFATVYNTLKTLKQSGMLTEIAVQGGKMRFDPDTSPHDHLICIQCKGVVDVHHVARPVLPGRKRAGYTLIGSQVEFFGVCPSCRGMTRPRELVTE